MTEQSAIQSMPTRKPRQPNPVYEHLTRRRKWPSIRATVVICILLNVIGVIIITVGWHAPILLGGGSYSPAARRAIGVVVLSVVALIITPFISAALTAISTARLAESDALTMLKLTNVSPRTIIHGLLIAAIFRLRLVWAICGGLLIPLLDAGIIITIESHRIYSRFDGADAPAVTNRIFLLALGDALPLVFGGVLLGVVINWLAICGSVWAGITVRKVAPALGISMAVAFVGLLAAGSIVWIGIIVLAIIYPVYPMLGMSLLQRAQGRIA